MRLIKGAPPQAQLSGQGLLREEFTPWWESQPLHGLTRTFEGRLFERYVRCEVAYRLKSEWALVDPAEYLTLMDAISRIKACGRWPGELDEAIAQVNKELEEYLESTN